MTTKQRDQSFAANLCLALGASVYALATDTRWVLAVLISVYAIAWLAGAKR